MTSTGRRAARVATAAVLALLLGGCASTGSHEFDGAPRPESGPSGQTGVASYYAHRYHGRTTASGETYDENALTAAHRTLPFGTRVRVTNLANGRRVQVRINDRGPFVAGRIIDVSWRAAGDLDFREAGLAQVRVEVLE